MLAHGEVREIHQATEAPVMASMAPRGGHTEDAVEADLHGVVADERDPGGGPTGLPAKGTRDVRIERPGGRVMAGHGHVADGEHQHIRTVTRA